MGPLLVITVCLIAGAVLRRTQRLPEDAHTAVDAFVINVALPALILADLHGVDLTARLFAAVGVIYVLFAVSLAIIASAARLLGWSRGVFGAVVLTCALTNTSFVGIPMIDAFFGSAYKPIGLLMDQLGTAILLSTVGVVIASLCASQALRAGVVVRRVLGFPPFVALCGALALHAVAFPGWLQSGLADLGATLAPMALFSAGLQMRVKAERAFWQPLAVGLVVKLLIAPAIVALVYVALVQPDQTMRVALFEAATPPMIGGAILASRYRLAPPLPSLLVGIGIPLSFLTLPVWAFVLHRW